MKVLVWTVEITKETNVSTEVGILDGNADSVGQVLGCNIRPDGSYNVGIYTSTTMGPVMVILMGNRASTKSGIFMGLKKYTRDTP